MTTPLMALTDETHPDYPHLRRLVFTRDHLGWTEGDEGGWAEHPHNVADNAMVTGNARISGNARITGNALVSGHAQVTDKAEVAGNATVTGCAWVGKSATIHGDARVSGNARIYGSARVAEEAAVTGNARVGGGASISGSAWASGNAWAYGEAEIGGDASFFGDTEIGGMAVVHRSVEVLTVADVSTVNHSATLSRTPSGHQIMIGCWTGTTTDLRILADSDDWPSGCDKAAREKHRPWLHAVADLFDARIAMWGEQ